MHCNACQHSNPESARFCGACGVPLAREAACPSCGHANPRDQRFCNGCGAPQGEAASGAPERAPRDYTPPHLAQRILTSRPALEGERDLRDARERLTAMGAPRRVAQVDEALAALP